MGYCGEMASDDRMTMGDVKVMIGGHQGHSGDNRDVEKRQGMASPSFCPLSLSNK
jgi:hypothetical protein